MECPYKDSLFPRCNVQAHPWRQDIEYCRVCGEWRNLNDVGSPIAHLLVIAALTAIAIMVLQSAMDEPVVNPPPLQPNSQVQAEVIPFVAPFNP